jgi:signal transduction histidine kinase
MNREEAKLALGADDPDERLRAARFYTKNARREEFKELRQARLRETVPWIRRALDRALEQATTGPEVAIAASGIAAEDEIPVSVMRQIRAQAVEEVAGTIIHEFAMLIGIVKGQAQAEVPNYPQSATHNGLERLSQLVQAVREIKQAASIPNFSQFDLADLVHELVASTLDTNQVEVRSAGQSPFLILSDRERLTIAIVNGLRNAGEAISLYSRIDPPQIVVNWGQAGPENWLMIMDTGPGFVGNPASAFKLGATNKKDHLGFGLPTARQAMNSIDGDVTLSDGTDGGARFELRWYKNAYPVR